jgi:hypothetical protein
MTFSEYGVGAAQIFEKEGDGFSEKDIINRRTGKFKIKYWRRETVDS